RARIVQRLEGRDARRTDVDARTRAELDEVERKGERAPGERVADRIGAGAHARLDAGRPRDPERVAALVLVDRGEQQLRDAGEVISVEVRERDGVDRVARDAELAEPGAGRGRAVEQQPARARLDEERGLPATAGPERVARPDEGDLHAAPPD